MKISSITRQVLVVFLICQIETLVTSWIVLSTQHDLGLTGILTEWNDKFNEIIVNKGY
jgi:hypothetical protein